MQGESTYDYIIIGQGLAGSVLSYHLILRGKRVLVLDSPSGASASRVAAGLYNPITGRKMVKTWECDLLFATLEPFYEGLEGMLGARFLHKTPIFRPFVSIAEQNDWLAKGSDPAYLHYIQEVVADARYSPWLHSPYGGLLLQRSGWVDLPALLDAYYQWLQGMGAFAEYTVGEEDVHLTEAGVQVGAWKAEKVIFCNGAVLKESPWWQWLPLVPTKGEIITMHSATDFTEIFNRGVFVLPIGPQRYRVGSTYNWREPESGPTPEGLAELQEKLEKLYALPYTVEGHVAGIRPAVRDRRPLMGLHPQENRMGVFGGLGAKGVSLAPYFGGVFAEFLENEKPLPAEVNIQRYFSLI